MAVKSVRAADVPRKPIRWLWRDRVPSGMISLVAGSPGTGKSLFAAYLAAEVSRSGRGVIVSAREDPLEEVARPRLEAAGARLDRVHFWSASLPADTEGLENEIREHDARLVVIDPIAAHLTVSIYQDQDVRRALTPLADVTERTGCAALLVSHTIKTPAKSAHPLQAVGGGGGGLTGAARMVYAFGRNPNDTDERVLASIKSNLRDPPKSIAFEIDVEEYHEGDVGYLILIGESDVSARALLTPGQDNHDRKPPEKRERAAEFLCRYLRLGPRPARDIKEDGKQYGFSWATLRRAADELDVLRPKGGPNSEWALPPELLKRLGEEAGDE